MLNRIQNKILLKYPLLWNTRFIPMVVLLVFVNLIYFVIGYQDGAIDFTQDYRSALRDGFYGTAIIVAILIFIIWISFYLRNNSFKDYYVKSKNALFYEWIQIFVILVLLFSFPFFVELGKETRFKTYFSEKKLSERCDIILNAGFFIDAPFESADIDTLKSVINKEESVVGIVFDSVAYKDYVTILGKKYNPKSLINRYLENFGFSNSLNDSLRTIKMRKILIEDNKQVVKTIMQSYLKICDEHNLKTNLTLDKWFTLTYKYPDFTNYALIAPFDVNAGAKEIDYEVDNTQKVYSKYYTFYNVLENNYKELVSAYEYPIYLKVEIYLGILYLGIGLSIVLLLFRVTSGRNWLISFILITVLNIFYGVLHLLFLDTNKFTYLILSILTGLTAIIWCAKMIFGKKKSRWNEIILNFAICFSVAMLPFFYFLIVFIFESEKYYYDELYVENRVYTFLIYNDLLLLIIYIPIVFGLMFMLSRLIRKWKGLPEV